MARRKLLAALAAATLATGLLAPAAAAAPLADPPTDPGSGELRLTPLSSIETGEYDTSAAEIVVHDPATQQLFVVNASRGQVELFDIADVAAPAAAGVLDPAGIEAADGSTIPAGTTANSVAVRDGGVLAVALEAPQKTDPGWVAFFTTAATPIGAVRVGSLPDMLTFTPDGSTLLVANEGEPAEDFSLDPEGSVSVIDVSGDLDALTQDEVRTADFRAWDQPGGPALPAGVRVFGPDVPDADGAAGAGRIARNLEPEYIVVNGDGTLAWVVLQEANTLAVLDIAAAQITELLPLGVKNHALEGNELDASDRDPEDAPTITIRNWPVSGVFMPDGADSFEVDGQTYIVTANEGDAREWGDYVEDERIKDLTLCPDADFGGYVGAGAEFATVEELQEDANLGRLGVTTEEGLREGEDCYEELYSLGGRSFAIWSEDGQLVFDSGADFERITAALLPDNFNSDNSEANLEGRSDNKGPEPEDVTVAELDGRFYAFIGFERVGGIAVYDVTDPANASFVTYVNNRDFDAFEGEDPTPEQLTAAGDLGPEGLIVIDAADSPLPGTPLLVVANEVSGTTTLFSIDSRPFAFDRGIADACPGSFPSAFDDIAGSIHEEAIRCAAAAGLTQGTSEPGLFAPAGAVTRAQMASFVERFIELARGEALPAGEDAFADDDTSVHEAAIDALAAAGVVEGFEDGTFAPGVPVGRGQLATILDRALDVVDDGELNDSYPPRTDEDLFADDDGSVHEPAIARLARQGVVAGYPDGTFRPGAAVRRDQAASYLLRSLDLAVTDGLADPVS
jgi:hypothetical protein